VSTSLQEHSLITVHFFYLFAADHKSAATMIFNCLLGTLLCICLSQHVNAQSILSITGDAQVELFVNGAARVLTNGGNWAVIDQVPIAAGDRLIAFHAQGNAWCSGVIASTTGGQLVTGYTFRCTENFYANWNQLGYDDIGWRFSYVVGDNAAGSPVCPKWQLIPQIHATSSWIWTANQTDEIGGIDS